MKVLCHLIAPLLALSAAGESRPNYVALVHDGWPSAVSAAELAELPAGTTVWWWSPECAPRRDVLPLSAPLDCQSTTFLEVNVTAGAERLRAGEVLFAPAEMYDEVPDDLLPRARIGSDGLARVPVRGSAPLRLRVADAWFASAWMNIEGRRSRVSIQAQAGADVVIATDQTDRIRVLLLSRVPGEAPDVLFWGAAHAGSVRIPSVPKGVPVTVLAWGGKTAPLVLPGVTDDLPDRIVLPPGRTLRGRVVDADSTGIPDVEITADCILPELHRAHSQKVTSRADGTFELGGIPDTRCVVLARKDEFVPAQIDAPLVDDPAALQLRLVPGRRVLVHVTSAREGAAVANARVEVLGGGPTALTDSQGKASLDGVPRDLFTLRVSADRFLESDVQVGSDAPIPVAVQLQAAARVRARFTFQETGQPAGPGQVRLERERGEVWIEPLASSGELDLVNLGPGSYRIEVDPDGAVPVVWEGLQLQSGAVSDLGDIAVESGLTIEGLVLDSQTHEPITGCDVRALVPDAFGARLAATLERWERTSTDADGVFRISGLDPAAYPVLVTAPGYAPVLLEGLVLEDDTPGGRLVVDPVLMEHGHSVEIACSPSARCGDSVALLLGSRANDWATVTARMVDGDALVTPVPGGELILRVLDRGFVVTEREVSVRSDRETTSVEISLDGTRIEGQVTRDSVPVGGGLVRIAPGLEGGGLPEVILDRRLSGQSQGQQKALTGRGRSFTATVDAAGEFSIDDVPAGTYTVHYRGPGGWESPSRAEEVPDTSVHRVQIDIGSGQLEGRVLTPEREVPQFASVTIADSSGVEATALCGANGEFSIAGLAPGVARVTAMGICADQPCRREDQVEIELDRPRRVTLILEVDEPDITVLVRAETGAPAVGAIVLLECGGVLSPQTTDSAGRARFRSNGCTTVRLAAFRAGWGYALAGPASPEPDIDAVLPATPGALILRADGPMHAVQIIAPNGFPLHRLLSFTGIPPAVGSNVPLQLQGLPAGTYTVVGRDGRTHTLTVRAGEIAEMEF